MCSIVPNILSIGILFTFIIQIDNNQTNCPKTQTHTLTEFPDTFVILSVLSWHICTNQKLVKFQASHLGSKWLLTCQIVVQFSNWVHSTILKYVLFCERYWPIKHKKYDYKNSNYNYVTERNITYQQQCPGESRFVDDNN